MRELVVCAPLVVTQLEVMASQAESRLTHIQDTTLRYRAWGRRLATPGRGGPEAATHGRRLPTWTRRGAQSWAEGRRELAGARAGRLWSSRFSLAPGCYFGKEVFPL